MTIIVFAGPSLTQDDKERFPNCTFRPPIKQGDVYRAAKERPDAIGIIDGYFEGVPSVWHKEILFALEHGIPVLGAASMGALRAAELDAFGMIGTGTIYEAYRDGVLEDDDEVAVLHGPEEAGFVAVSLPMVNVRAALDEAIAASIVNAEEATTIIASAKAIHYRDRTWETVLPNHTELLAWVLDNAVDAKRADALALLERITSDDPLPRPAAVQTAPSHVFLRAQAVWDMGPAQTLSASDKQVLEVWLMTRTAEDQTELKARLRQAVLDPASSAEEADIGKVRAILDELRQRHALPTRADLDRWMEKNDLDAAQLEAILRDDARVQDAATQGASLAEHVIAVLKRDGLYGELLREAEQRQSFEAGPIKPWEHPGLADWYETTTGKSVFDLGEMLGRTSLADLSKAEDCAYRLIARERLYLASVAVEN